MKLAWSWWSQQMKPRHLKLQRQQTSSQSCVSTRITVPSAVQHLFASILTGLVMIRDAWSINTRVYSDSLTARTLRTPNSDGKRMTRKTELTSRYGSSKFRRSTQRAIAIAKMDFSSRMQKVMAADAILIRSWSVSVSLSPSKCILRLRHTSGSIEVDAMVAEISVSTKKPSRAMNIDSTTFPLKWEKMKVSVSSLVMLGHALVVWQALSLCGYRPCP